MRTKREKARAQVKTCLNPKCGSEFVLGHYGARQKVCTGSYVEKCGRCKGKACKRCRGKGTFRQSCASWYKVFWAQTRRPPRGIPEPDWDKIEKAAASEDQRHHALLVVTRESALRKGEVLGITNADLVGPDGDIPNEFPLRGQWDDNEGFKPTKTGAARPAYLSDRARQVLRKLPKGEPTDRVFPFWESAVYRWFIALQKRLGIVNPATGYPYRFHDIRHTLVSELVRAQRIDLAKKLAGHKNYNTTLGYAEMGADEFIAAVAAARGKNGRRR